VTIDITFPGDQAWDGHRSMCLACGDGHDFPAGDDPDAEKAALEASYCDPQVREASIASLAFASSHLALYLTHTLRQMRTTPGAISSWDARIRPRLLARGLVRAAG
jgi:hypothetical protein